MRIYIVIILLCLCRPCVNEDIMFPFGTAVGDSAVPTSNNGSSGLISISTLFPFYDHNHDSLYVNTDGAISFLSEVSQYSSDPFPLDGDRRLIAPFWADVDTNNGGTVYYRQVLPNNNEGLADRATQIVRDTFIDQDDFRATWLFIATWDNVSYYGSTNTSLRNSFQAVLVTNGLHSFTFFHYGDIMWTTDTTNGGSPDTGLGGTPAQVGFNAGDGQRSYSLPGSRNASIINIDTTTNVDVIGRWVFRTDKEKVVEDGCKKEVSTGTLTVFPSFGSMLGGDIVIVQGPCFDLQYNISCSFIYPYGVKTPGIVLNTLKAACVTPTFWDTGPTKFYVSNDGGQTYGFEGVLNILNFEDVVTPVTVDYDLSSTLVTVTWNTSFTPYELVNIELFTYTEEWGQLNVASLIRRWVKEKVDGATGVVAFQAIDVTISDDDHIGIFRVSKYNGKTTNWFLPAVWSEVMDLGWLRAAQNVFHEFQSDPWCSEWEILEKSLGSFLEDTQDCPCTFQQALADTGRFTLHSACYLPNNYYFGCNTFDYIPQCVRATTPSKIGSGIECCYGPNGDLLNIQDHPYAGFSHRRHYKGDNSGAGAGTVPYLSHFAADILPFRYCCYYSHHRETCEHFKDRRPSKDCTTYVPPPIGGGYGDPHIRTLDGTSYTFNGHGEYTFIEALDKQFVMQCRMEPITGRNASRITAMAAKFNETDSVHIGLSERRGLDARIKSDSGWQLVDFERTNFREFNGFSVYKPNSTKISFTAIFDSGIAFTMEETSDIMSVVFTGSEAMKGSTRGLLGNWNDNATDDLMTPNGDVISSNSSLRDIHFNFGQLWSIDPQEALFYYEPGKSHSDYSDPSFLPIFEPPDNIDDNEIQRVCGSNFECMFDYQVTEDPVIADATRTNVKNLERLVEYSKPVVACPFVSAPTDGNKNGTSNLEGSSLIFTCDNRFYLNGSDHIVCLANGTWSDNPPICFRNETTCPNVTAPENGSKNGSNSIGNNMVFSCDYGFKLIGNEVIMCQENNTWSGSEPVCLQGGYV
ncbi:sushi domain-containing protein 2-like [Anneissia japonica]|uniref:sushi domain-containing protein 2-like n=1 Tax=Anneissia japonica TaxID=1529436 RepID=UPI00142572AD|nr:sushi domain-containing protein 2-like [Anneissia japonica]